MLEISLHILDIVENSTRAGAKTVYIDIIEDTAKDILSLKIRDDGSGMSEDVLNKVIDPFFTTKTVRSVGLGLPMLAQAAERAEGRFTIESKGGKGTRVAADFKLSHIDRQPLGDIAGTLVTLIAGNEDVDLIYRHAHNGKEYILDTREIKKEIEDIPINHVAVSEFHQESYQEGLKEIGSRGMKYLRRIECMKAGNGDLDIQKEFTPEQLAKLDEIIKKSKDKPGALIPVLEEAQMVLEFLPMPILQIIAKGLNLPLSRVYGVVTFYSFFTMTPRGKHTLRVCLGTACYVRGGKSIMETIQKELGVKEKETTPDRLFSLESVRCLGACGLAPVIVITEDVHGRMKTQKVRDILNQYREETVSA